MVDQVDDWRQLLVHRIKGRVEERDVRLYDRAIEAVLEATADELELIAGFQATSGHPVNVAQAPGIAAAAGLLREGARR